MLTPDYLEHCADDVIEVYQQLDESIARDIARRFIRMGEISDTSRWQAEQLQHAGALQDDIIRSVAQYSGTAEDEIRTAFTDAGVETVETDMELYHRSGTVDPDLTISMTERASNVLSANLQKINTSNIDVCVRSMRNLTLTTAVASQQRFIEAASLASLQVNSGLMSYQQAIRNAIVDAASQGATVLYPSGHVDKLDVAVRRAVVTGVNQTSGKITETLADEFECDLMEITAHFGARPSHAEWQGQIVSRSGRHGYLSLSDIGYGTGDGFQGWNCRHSWNPFFEGISTRAWTDEQLQHLNDKDVTYNDKQYTQYEMSQMMRSVERGIRGTKRELAALDEAIQNTDDPAIKAECQKAFDEKSMELSKQKNKYKDLCNADGNLNSPNKSRTDVYGFGRSTSQKAVHTAKRIEKELEKNRKIDKIQLDLKQKSGVMGNVSIYPSKLDTSKLTFDFNHINKERNHNVTEEKAKSYIKNAVVSVKRWNGKFEDFYSPDGAAYVDVDTNEIRTAFSKEEYTDRIITLVKEAESIDKPK